MARSFTTAGGRDRQRPSTAMQRRMAESPDDMIGARRPMPGFNMDVGTPAELEGGDGMDGIPLNQLVDLNPKSFGNSPAAISNDNNDPFYENLLDKIGDSEITRIATHLDQLIENDAQARQNFDKIVARGIQETGYDRMNDQRTSPFPGASAVVHPLMAQASTDFSSRAIRQLFPSKGPIKTEIEGTATEADLKRAELVRRFMNWMLKVRCKSYRTEMEKLLSVLPFSGDCVKKLYWDHTEMGFGRPKSEFVLPDKFIVPYATSDLEETPRYCHELDLWKETAANYMDTGLWKKVHIPTAGDRPRRSQQKEKSDRVEGKSEPIDLNKDQICFREVYVDWYFPQLQDENDQVKEQAGMTADQVKAAKEAQAQAQQQPQDGGGLGAPLPNMTEGDEMVDLGAMDGARATTPAGAPLTDPDAVGSAEVQAEPKKKPGDDRDRLDAEQYSSFPAGPKLPYIITYHRDSKTPVAVYRNWKKSDANQRKRVWFSHYVMFPWRSWNGLGLWHLIGGLAKAATGSLRALMDSAVIDNLPGGVRLANTRLSGDDITYRPMEFAKINAPGIDDIRKAVMPYPKNETSTVLLELLKIIVSWGQNFATAATQELMDLAPNTPATTILQILEHTGAVYSAIHARLHLAQEQEFQLLAELIAENIPEEGFAFSDEQGEDKITAADFKGVKIGPVSDPDTFSEIQRSMRSEAALALTEKARTLGVNADARRAVLDYAQSIGISDPEKLFPEAAKAIPRDPLSELMAVIKGQPVDAFPGQNHKAHVAFLKQAAQNPNYQGLIQGVLPQFTAIGQAHSVWMMRDELEARAGQALPFNKSLPPQIAGALAQQCAQLLSEITKDVMASGPDPLLAPGMSSDPLMQMAQTEREKVMVMREEARITAQQKDDELDRKMAEQIAEIEHKERIVMFEAEQRMNELLLELQVKLTLEFAKLDAAQEKDAAKLAADITKMMHTSVTAMQTELLKRAHDAREGSAERTNQLQIETRRAAATRARSSGQGGAGSKAAA